MLRIEKLFLQGFKSFNDPTEVILDEEGITAVVGPNGCGKSNVADAINWVIGEQRAKALRGGKMEDVIFQGSRNRQPAGMAEVLLTMVVRETFELRGETNQSNQFGLPAEIPAEAPAENPAPENLQEPLDATSESGTEAAVDASSETSSEAGEVREEEAEEAEDEIAREARKKAEKEAKRRQRLAAKTAPRVFHEGERIVVGRRLYRTGESEYEMNGRICRLRDVQDLFAGTGLGGAHYAIIEQGRIGQVLSAKPLDRRALIEEAAGISKFKMRQHSAELKLEASRQNLSRVTDILVEIERQQNSLKRQAARARRYQRLKQEMRDLMRAVYLLDYRATRMAITDIEGSLGEMTARESEIASSIAATEETQAEAVRIARGAEESLNETRQIAAGIDIETERAKQQHAYLNEQMLSLAARSDQFARDQAAIIERRRFIDQETARLREELQKIEREINVESRTLAEAEENHRAQLDRDADSERTLEEARNKVYESVTHLERWRQLKRQFTDSVDRSQSKLEGLKTEAVRARAQAQAAEEQYAELSAKLEEVSLRQQQTGTALADLVGNLGYLKQTQEERQTALTALQRELTATEHRLRSLDELDQRRAYFSEAVQALMKRDPQLNGFKTLGTLADFVEVAPEHESMIDSALRDELQYVVVPSFDDALGAIDFLKSEGAGRATFLVVGLHGSETAGSAQNGDDPHHRTLASLLGLRPEFGEAFKLALPTLASARIVEDAHEAIRKSVSAGNGAGPAPVAFSSGGERVIAGRLISGGSSSETGIGVLGLKREIVELTEKLAAQSLSSSTTELALSEVKTRIADLEESRLRMDEEARQCDKDLAVLREQYQQCERERERSATHIRVIEQETAQAEAELTEVEKKLEHAVSQAGEAEQTRAEAEQIVQAAQDEMAVLRRRSEERSQELSRRRAEFAAVTERRRGLQNDIRRLENEANDLESRLGRSRLEALEANEQSSATQSAIQAAAEQLQSLLERQQARAAELEQRTVALAAARERLEALDADLRNARVEAGLARDLRSQKEIEKAKMTSDLEHLINSCYTELGENIAEISERLEKAKQIESEGSDSSPLATADDAPDPIVFSEPARLEASSEKSGEEIEGEFAEDDEFGLETDIMFWDIPDDFDLDSAKSRLDELRVKIDSLGPVNMMALEELTEIEQRFEFLSTQKTDIEKAIADTQAAIAEIKRRSRERFQEAFYAINENFKLMFQELFGGGRGEMRLIDETDILESGIEIIAQPPGKRLQNVLLLSGGEKAMAALSLVLAIFKYRPSPFCLLDEVDAPLDEVNIGRFADKVIEMSHNTQFMIITHSKRTMEAAKTLYGVTMEDPGVSKLISVKLTS